jgi:DNA polymerase V
MQTSIHQGRRAVPAALLSLTRPNRELLHRQRAMLRRAIPAGLPHRLSLDEHLDQHRESTFFMRAAGDSMRGLGILDGDLLVVDRAQPATHGSMVIAVLDGEFSVKQLLHTPQGQVLRAAHPDCEDVRVEPGRELAIWGVVNWNIHRHQS